jgi:hypothetical protein
MAITLEDLAARLDMLEREKARAEQKAIAAEQRVAALEEEIRALRAAPETPSQGHHGAVRRTLRRPITRLGLLAAAGAAGASAALPAGARAATHPASISPHAQLISPNGQYVLDVVNSGIFLKGPVGGIEITGSQIKIASTANVSIQGAAQVSVGSPALVAVTGGVLKLNSGSHQVARVGDIVTVTVAGVSGSGTITTGSTTVLA